MLWKLVIIIAFLAILSLVLEIIGGLIQILLIIALVYLISQLVMDNKGQKKE